jgi:sugar phosphate isomerase/epimerase
MAKNVLGVQLYTLRQFTKTKEDVVKTFKKVADIGFKSVQVSAMGDVSAEDVRKIADENGLTINSTHVKWQRLLEETDAVIKEHKIWNCSHTCVPILPEEYYSEKGLEKFAGEVVPLAKKLAKGGITLSYHNHKQEFAKLGDKVWLELMYAKVPAELLKAEIDTYWVYVGGGDPAQWVARYPGRQPLFHLKDIKIMPDKEQRMAEIGEGLLDWKKILEAAKKSNVEWYLIEQDNCYERDPFESLAMSYNFLKKLGLS